MPVNRLMLEMFENCEFAKHKSNLEVAVLNGVIESRTTWVGIIWALICILILFSQYDYDC